MGPGLLFQCPERVRASYPRASEGWGRLSMTLDFQYALFLLHGPPTSPWTPVAARTQTQTCPGQQFDPDDTMAPDGSTKHPDQYSPGGSKALGHQNGLRWLSRPWACDQPPGAIGNMDINPDPGCCWVSDPDMSHCSCLGPDMSIAPCDSVGHPDYHSPDCNISLRHE